MKWDQLFFTAGHNPWMLKSGNWNIEPQNVEVSGEEGDAGQGLQNFPIVRFVKIIRKRGVFTYKFKYSFKFTIHFHLKTML